MKKKICPPGQLCIGSNFLVTVLVFVIAILLFYLLTSNISNNKFSVLNKTPDNVGCSRKFLDLEKKMNNIKMNNIKMNNIKTNNIKTNNENPRELDLEQDLEQEQEFKNSQEIIIKFQPETTKSYLANKDYERVINPLLPPERRNPYIDPNSQVMVSPGVPINIPTRGETGGYQQLGVLHKIELTDETMQIGNNSEPVILPLLGAPTYNGSNKWIYYTATDKYNQIKLPITNNNRKCDSEYGCDELYDGDTVTIPAYNGSFKVNKYQFDKPRYLPFVV